MSKHKVHNNATTFRTVETSSQLLSKIPSNVTEQTVICPVTGISFSISLPPIPSLFLEWTSPFASISVVKQFANLSYKDITSTYDNNITAGLLLSALSHHHLIEDKLTAIHRNIILSAFPNFLLVQAIHFIMSCSDRQISWIPKISLHLASETTIGSEITEEAFTTWLDECNAIVNPIIVKNASSYLTATEEDNAREYSIKRYAARMVNKSKNAISNLSLLRENKESFIDLYAALKEEDRVPRKLLPLLALLKKGDALMELAGSIRDKLVGIIEKSNSDHAAEAKNIICNRMYYNKDKEAIPTELELNIASPLQDETPMKLTLSQVIATRKAGLSATRASLIQLGLISVPEQEIEQCDSNNEIEENIARDDDSIEEEEEEEEIEGYDYGDDAPINNFSIDEV